MKKILLLLFSFCFIKSVFAQHQDVFPGVTGNDLLENLIDTYKLVAYPDQANNRDTLFGVVDNINDSLVCVYTNYKIWLDPSLDPTQDAFSKGINTEHTYPKSLGAEGFAEGDMHHLYPAREDVNNDRGNLPFAEIPDDETQNWYYLGQEIFSIPVNNIDLYSERKNGFFEPPEAHKGNTARAMMYFYTMYKEIADAADPTYFEAQRETLCAWHFLDPVDQREWDRTWKIAEYQEGKPNPFVLDCTLPERTYCQDFGQSCDPTSVREVNNGIDFFIDGIDPNPIKDGAHFYFNSKYAGDVCLEIYNLNGVRVDLVNIGYRHAGINSFYWEKKDGLPSGITICQLSIISKHGKLSSLKKAVILTNE